jgi:hypothetical protein
MLTRALTTLTLLLTFTTAGTDAIPPAGVHLDRSQRAHRARMVDLDDVGGCREPAPAPVPVAPASCSDEGGQP